MIKIGDSIVEWWQEEYGFFGNHYLEGDDSKEGYLQKRKQSLTQRTNTEVAGIINLLDLQPDQRILDIPCGYGRHSIGLAQKSLNVLGVDLNSVHLNKAFRDAEKAKVKIDFRKGDMESIGYSNEFDAVINVFYSFGFFETEERNFRVLQNFYQVLKNGGKFLFHTDVNVPRILQGKYKQDEVRQLTSGKQLKIIENYDSLTKRINGSWIIQDANGAETRKDYSVRVYFKDEFITFCRQAGFQKFWVYSDWDGSIYKDDSEDMIIIAQK